MPVSRIVSKVIRRTGVLFVVAVAAWLIPLTFDFPITFYFPPAKLWHLSATPLHYLAVIALFFQGLMWSKAIINHWADTYIEHNQANRHDASSVRFVAVLARIAIAAILFVIMIDALGKSVTGLITGLGIGGIAVAFALQNVLGDLFGAVSIAFDKPFIVGDAIQVDDFSGTVERIGLKSTRVRSDNGEEIVFANGELLKGRIRNFGSLQQRRSVLVLKFAGNTTPDKLERIPKIIKDVVEARPNTRFVRANFKAIGDVTLDVEAVYYLTSASYQLFADTHQEILIALLREFEQAEIELAVQLDAAVREHTAGRNASHRVGE
jgi:small-conductance mechanosensitive channel